METFSRVNGNLYVAETPKEILDKVAGSNTGLVEVTVTRTSAAALCAPTPKWVHVEEVTPDYWPDRDYGD